MLPMTRDGEERDADADDAADRGEYHALGEQLPQQPEAAGAERHAQRDLAGALVRKLRQQVGHVGEAMISTTPASSMTSTASAALSGSPCWRSSATVRTASVPVRLTSGYRVAAPPTAAPPPPPPAAARRRRAGGRAR